MSAALVFTWHNLRGKEARHQVSGDAADSVHGENIERIVNAKDHLQLGGKVANDGAHDTKDKRGPGRHVPGGGRDGNETGNDTAAEADRAPLPLEPVIKQAPGQAADTGRDVRHDAGHDGAHVGAEGAAAVEAEPADPEENGAQDDVGDVVGTVRQTVDLGVAGASSEHEGVGEGGGARGNVHGSAAGKVEATHDEGPPVRVPCPVGDRVVHDGEPDEDEDDAGEHAATVGSGANCEGRAVES